MQSHQTFWLLHEKIESIWVGLFGQTWLVFFNPQIHINTLLFHSTKFNEIKIEIKGSM